MSSFGPNIFIIDRFRRREDRRDPTIKILLVYLFNLNNYKLLENKDNSVTDIESFNKQHKYILTKNKLYREICFLKHNK